MTTEPLTRIHFIGAAFTVHGRDSRVMEYGDELAITPEFRQANLDRNGHCWLDMIDNEDAQISRWGRVMFRRGPWPEGQLRFERGSVRWETAYTDAIRQAWKIEDDVESARRRREIRALFGPPLPTSKTLQTYGGPDRV